MDHPINSLNRKEVDIEKPNAVSDQQNIRLLRIWIGACEMCNRQGIQVGHAILTTDSGMEMKTVCAECAQKYDCTPSEK